MAAEKFYLFDFFKYFLNSFSGFFLMRGFLIIPLGTHRVQYALS
jgi:hypothetical protein